MKNFASGGFYIWGIIKPVVQILSFITQGFLKPHEKSHFDLNLIPAHLKKISEI
jgi:hypothetical protein